MSNRTLRTRTRRHARAPRGRRRPPRRGTRRVQRPRSSALSGACAVIAALGLGFMVLVAAGLFLGLYGGGDAQQTRLREDMRAQVVSQLPSYPSERVVLDDLLDRSHAQVVREVRRSGRRIAPMDYIVRCLSAMRDNAARDGRADLSAELGDAVERIKEAY